MNLNDIRTMSDRELNTFLKQIRKAEKRVCEKCGEFILNKRTISVRKEQTTRTLCVLCESCYSDMLDFLEVADVEF